MRKKIYLIFEFILIFISIPVLMRFYYNEIKGYIIPILIVIAGFFYIILKRDPVFDIKRIKLYFKFDKITKYIVARFILLGLFSSLVVYCFIPDIFLKLPRTHFLLWLAIMVLYPVLSVYPQELIYRVFLFHRYKVLFQSNLIIILISAANFGFVHIIFGNAVAPLLSFIGGLMFAHTYYKSNSIFYSSLEHSLWGAFIFTIGLGIYFSDNLITKL